MDEAEKEPSPDPMPRQIALLAGLDRNRPRDAEVLHSLVADLQKMSGKGKKEFMAEYSRDSNIILETQEFRQIVYNSPHRTKRLSERQFEICKYILLNEIDKLSFENWQELNRTYNIDGRGADTRHDHAHIFWIDDKHQRLLSEFLELSHTNQDSLVNISGRYLIIRKIQSNADETLYLLSSMDISYVSGSHLATFSTLGHDGLDIPDAPVVNGIIFRADSNFLFSVGKILDSNQVRTSILMPRPTGLVGPSQQTDLDLIGIRLGMGRFGDLPQAYGIWCTRIQSGPKSAAVPAHLGLWKRSDFARSGKLSSVISDPEPILSWLDRMPTLRLADPKKRLAP